MKLPLIEEEKKNNTMEAIKEVNEDDTVKQKDPNKPKPLMVDAWT